MKLKIFLACLAPLMSAYAGHLLRAITSEDKAFEGVIAIFLLSLGGYFCGLLRCCK